MTEYRYTDNDRVEQLRTLERSLVELIPTAERLGLVQAQQYMRALEQTRELLVNGFTQADLTVLARAVPDVFLRHKDWLPPLEKAPDGSWQEPAWFPELEEKLQPALSAAGMLSTVGFY